MTVTVSDLQERKAAAKALRQVMKDGPARTLLSSNRGEHVSATVLCLESDTIESVARRIRDYDPPVVLAVYWPQREELALGLLTPSGERQATHFTVHHDTTIGMILESGESVVQPSAWDHELMVSPIEP